MHDVSILRLNLLRAAYALVLFGLAVFVWPNFLANAPALAHMHGVVCAMLFALSLLAGLGLLHPLRMLPLLLFELAWKVAWLALVAWPLWRDVRLEGGYAATTFDNLFGLAVWPWLIPWKHGARTYLRAAPEPWRRARAAAQ